MAVEFVAPQKVYRASRSSAQERLSIAGYTLPAPLGLTKTKSGGMATWFPGHPFPRKTFIYPGLVESNNKVKRIILTMLLPFASIRYGVKSFLNSYLLNLNRLISSIYEDLDQTPYLYYEYYSELGKSLLDFSYLFLRYLGVKAEIAFSTAIQLTTAIESDDAYRVRLQDILNECNRDELLKNPRKEILRVMEIYRVREISFGETDGDVKGKFTKLGKLLRLLLFLPPVKKAFIFAIKNINFDYFKLDEWDEYWTLNRIDYKCNGKTFEERMETMIQMMANHTQKINPDKEVRVEKNEAGQTLINLYDK